MSEPRSSGLGGRATPIPPNPRAPVLIVDDEEDVRDSLREVLEEAGYDVYCAGDGKQALELLGRADPSPGLILLDMVMPVMNGQEMLEALKQVHALAAIPVTIVSASKQPLPSTLGAPGGPSASSAPDPGSSYLAKPVDFDALLAIVEKTCG
ncbi:MAG: response regulator [Polyangiaceae bacterium]|nr:response regulator [Polyangiaceae bacterium]